MGYSSLFTVANFATLDEIRPLIDCIPEDASPDVYDVLRQEDRGPSRAVGAALIAKMKKFKDEADDAYSASLTSLDTIRSVLSDGAQAKYLSLFEIADMSLPQSLKQNGTFPPSALYAVHTALNRNDIIFRPLSPTTACHRKEHLFEIFPYHDFLLLGRVSLMVRDYTDFKGKEVVPGSKDTKLALSMFITKAREVVEASRSKRQWTPYAIISPSTEPTQESVEWSRSSRDIIQFLKWWAAHDLFDESSRFHTYGSLILRFTELYPDAILDQSTAWTFLQEIGEIPSWEVPSRYKVRFPSTRVESGGGLIRDVPSTLEDSLRPDIAAGARKQWEHDTVFCIDGPSTMLIDDGVSLERTDKKDEFWIHVHTADPASGILPNSKLSQFMELIPENIYLPGHFQAMLPFDLGVDNSNDYKSNSLVDTYSLANGRPSLTFSARVNLNGDLLDYKIEPGTVKKVLYLDPQDVSEFCNEPPPPALSRNDSLVVGTPPDDASIVPNRPVIAAKDLDEPSKNDLLVLYQLAEAVRRKRLDKGAWPYFFPRPSVSVSFPQNSVQPQASQAKKHGKVLAPDPYIKVGYESSTGCSVVSNSMVLAGEIAARWCADRGIPLPYRKDVNSSKNSVETVNYAKTELYPLIQKGIEPSHTQRHKLSVLTGGIEMSSRPGPYFMLGLDMYAKATSPLRRFSDLIVHWQIHAALAYERQQQRSIDPGVDELNTILPFTSNNIGDTLSLLELREKMARAVAHGSRDWILMALVRAWHFEKTFTRPLRFTVGSRWRQGVSGKLDLFDLEASMTIDGIDGQVLVKNINTGDQFDVELVDVNVHSRQILVKAIRYLGGGGGGGGSIGKENVTALDDASTTAAPSPTA